MEILPFDDRFCFLTQVSEQGRADDKEQVFEQGEIEQEQDELQDQLSENEEEADPAVLHLLHPLFEPAFQQHVTNGTVARSEEEIDPQ